MTHDLTNRTLPLARPNITRAEIEAVTEVLSGPNLSLGPKLAEFEQVFAQYCRTRHAIACSSGTAALHMLIRALGIGPGDEVITTPFSFVASANCALMEGATPVFVDIDPKTWNINPDLIAPAITPRTKAILPVDVLGQVAEMDAINQIAQQYDLKVIEDSCEALGSRYKDKPAGSLGDAGVFGFYPNKQMTTGEGGMVVTDDGDLADLCRSLRNQGRAIGDQWLSHTRLGYNYRLSDLNCALGLAQLHRIDEIIETRRQIVSYYHKRLSENQRLQLQQVHADVQMSWFVFVVRLVDSYDQSDRDRVMDRLKARGIMCANYFPPIHLQPLYTEKFGYKRGTFPVCEALADRTIALPLHHELTEKDVARVCDELETLL